MMEEWPIPNLTMFKASSCFKIKPGLMKRSTVATELTVLTDGHILGENG